MGTRAQFFVGNPADVAGRCWLGSVAFDGYPQGDCGAAMRGVRTEKAFRAAVKRLAQYRRDFCDPKKNDFPFPWLDDVFVTDVTYAWFAGKVQVTWFRKGFVPLAVYQRGSAAFRDEYHSGIDRLPRNVPAPRGHGAPGPDSILIISSPAP